MSALRQPGFRRQGWAVSDEKKLGFVIEAALDTFVKNELTHFGEAYAVNGWPVTDCVKKIFDRFNWFVRRPERWPNLQRCHVFNMIFLSEILDYYIKTELLIDGLVIHHDGSTEWLRS